MATARAGVLTSVEVSDPTVNSGPSGLSLSDLLHPKAPATWSLIWFLIAVFFLFIL